MKQTKILALIMSGAMVMGLSGCQGSGKVESTPEKAEITQTEKAVDDKTSAPSQDAIVIKIACGLAEGTPMVVGSQVFEETLERLTNGRYDVQVYANAELGDDTVVTEAVSLGTLEMCCTTPSVFTGVCPDVGVFDMPFLFTNTEGADEVFDGEIGTAIGQTVEKNGGVHILGYFENGFRNITNSVREVHTPEDLKGLKIRTPESEVFLKTFELLGTNPTPMAFSEVFTALQQKTIDGQENPLNTIYLNNLYEVQDYVTRTGHIYSPHMFCMNKSFYDGLSDEDKAAVDEAAKAAVDANRKLSRELDEGYVKSLEEAGMTVTTLTPEEKAVWVEAVSPIYEEYSGKYGDLITQIQDIMAAYN